MQGNDSHPWSVWLLPFAAATFCVGLTLNRQGGTRKSKEFILGTVPKVA
jgi:hypothetical protein